MAASSIVSGAACARAAAVAAVVCALGAAPAVRAQGGQPSGTPVRWDQARVTKMAQELAVAVHEAREAVRRSPMSHNIAQRTVYYELTETMRLVENTAKHLQAQLEAGKDAVETRAVFERISSLRYDAEELGRRALIEEPVIDALVTAGALHNRMKPYYYGKN
jgi:hypothetical protein